MHKVTLPGSRTPETAEFGAARGRLSPDELDTLAELIRWWRHRRAVGDSADPLETGFGGVDGRYAVQTVGLVPATVVSPKPVVIDNGASFLVQALGVPQDVAAAGEVYSLLGLCHFYNNVESGGYYSRYATIGRAPAGTTSTEIRTAVQGSPGVAVLVVVGVAGLTIDWVVEVLRLEVG